MPAEGTPYILNDFEACKPKITAWEARTGAKWRNRNDVLFELAFCLCTPQSPAKRCREAIRELKREGLLKGGSARQIAGVLRRRTRFHNNKAAWIVEARGQLGEILEAISQFHGAPRTLRERLVENVKGFGVKEASHFLRNIGLGEELAILDVHVVRWMAGKGLAEKEDLDKGLNYRRYIEYEQRFSAAARELGLSVLELDCTIWLKGSGSPEIM